MLENIIPVGILGGLALFIILWDTLGPRRRGAKNSDKQTVTRNSEGNEGNRKIPYAASSDFSALIHAIRDEGESNRDEERREERGKRHREITTIGLLFFTMCAIIWQVVEMIQVYGPIKDQADAAGKAIIASDKSLIEAQRAWVGPLKASIDGEPTIDKPVEITITYYNTGREPAVGFMESIDVFAAPTPDGAFAAMVIQQHLAACRDVKEWDGGSVVYPTVGGFGGGYTFYAKSIENFVGPNMTRGDEVIIINGCFHYRTFELPRHSFFCYFFKHGQTKIDNLNICPTGHEAD